jgi:hypothetical protein
MTIDIAIASVPYIGYASPPAAPALLKGHLLKHGFTSKVFEFNIEFKNFFTDKAELGELINYWAGVLQTLSEELSHQYHQRLRECANRIINAGAGWLGVSVFSRDSVKFVSDFLPYLVELKSSNQKILLGGHGLTALVLDDLSPYYDCYILGDGEIALLELLKGNMSYPGINSSGVQISNLDDIGWADYSDYNLAAGYDSWYDNTTLIPITGSKGCVRDCSFCNVNSIWEKFKYRRGSSLAQEIIHNYEKTNHKHFHFTDSLINGNLRELLIMMQELAKYNEATGAGISWGGQWISRKQKGLPKDYYKLIAASGGRNLTIGVETGSDQVRAHMKKGFTNDDLDAEMEQFSKHGITCGFFIIVGYPTETEEDFKDTLRMLKRYVKYVADGTLIGVGAGPGFIPDDTVPLAKQNLIQLYNPNSTVRWRSKHSNHLENVRRKLLIQKVLNNLSYPSNNVEYDLLPILKKSSTMFSEQDKSLVRELLLIPNTEVDSDFLAPSEPEEIELELLLEGASGETLPDITIQVNNTVLFSGQLDGLQTFCYTVSDCRRRNLVTIKLNNKIEGLSVEESHKHVMLKELVINGSRFRQDKIYMMGRVHTQQEKKSDNGLYSNGTLKIFFENPVHKYFIKQQRFFFESRYVSNKILIDKISTLFEHFVQ